MPEQRDIIRWCADQAGRRTTPYPSDPAAAHTALCPGCGADMSGLPRRNGLALVYCSQACQRRVQRVWRTRREDDERVLGLRAYSW